MKSFKKFFSVLFVCALLSLTVCSDYISCYNVRASGVISDISNDLLYYFLSITGSISKKDANNGLESSISSVSSAVRSALLDEITDQITNNGIYEDNGQIIFTSQAMQDLYYILNGDTNVNVRVVNDFSNFNIYGHSSYANYVNNTFLQSVTTLINQYNASGIPYIIMVDNSYVLNPAYYTQVYIFKLDSNLSFLSCNNTDYLYFYNNNSQTITYYYDYVYCRYNPNGSGSFETNSRVNNGSRPFLDDFSHYPDYFNSFPNLVRTSNNKNRYLTIYCNNSLLLASTLATGNGAINQNSGNFYFNNYNSISVEKNIITNNNWSSIYNSYVTNVSNTYNTEVINNNGSDLTSKQVRKIMNTYLQPIYNAIDDGLTDIAEKVDYINEWLFKIYQNQGRVVNDLDTIIQLLQSSVSGSGSSSTTSGCVWTTEQAAIVVDKITRLYTEQTDSNIDIVAALEYLKTRVNNIDGYTSDILDNSDTIVTDLATINTALDTIADKLDDLGGGVDITLPNIPLDVIDDIIDLLTDEVDDIVDSLDVVGNVLETAVPFCFLAAFGAIINGLSATPVEPEALTWEIPFDSGDGVVNEVFVIDWSFLDSIHSIWVSFVVIVFVIGLMALSFRIFTTFGTLIN